MEETLKVDSSINISEGFAGSSLSVLTFRQGLDPRRHDHTAFLNVPFGENKLELSFVAGQHHEQIHNASYNT
jgi:hypothetical protein